MVPPGIPNTTLAPAASSDRTIDCAPVIVRSLEAAGAKVVFGIPGGTILPAYDPLMDSTKLRHILVRHEQGAGHAAEGYAYSSGQVGVCMAGTLLVPHQNVPQLGGVHQWVVGRQDRPAG